jgi:hypothetical protein
MRRFFILALLILLSLVIVVFANLSQQHFISEDELAKMAFQTEDAYRKGKTKQLKSLADLCSK